MLLSYFFKYFYILNVTICKFIYFINKNEEIVEVKLKLENNMEIVASNKSGLETMFDAYPAAGAEGKAATPMEVMLETIGACSMMDIAAIIRKKRKQITKLEAIINSERAAEHPKVFTKVNIKYILTSPDAELKDLERAVELSHSTYCAVSTMFKRSGSEVNTESELIKA